MENFDENISQEAHRKMSELLTCGNERVELAAAKELLSAFGKNSELNSNDIHLEVTIKII